MMGYHCGIGLGMAALGIAPRDPHVTCDGDGCVAVENGLTARDDWPKAWMRNGKAPPGWKLVPVPDGKGFV